MFYPKNQSSYTIRPDVSAEALGPRTLRRATAVLETVMTVSPDGKTMTITTRTPGSADEPSVFVYEKQD